MEEVSKNPKSYNRLLNLFLFLLGAIVTFGLYFSAFEYKYANTSRSDLAYGACYISSDSTKWCCQEIDPAVGCFKTIYQAENQVENERQFFASAVVLIGILISLIFIWFIFKNIKRNTWFLVGSVIGYFISMIFIYFYHFTLPG